MNKHSIFAGICIGIAALANWLAPTPIVGAILFCFGLLAILENNGQLCTGMFGNCHTENDWIDTTDVLAGNVVGAAIIGLLTALFLPKLTAIVYDSSLFTVFIKSLLCGALIHLGVDGYKKGNKVLLGLCIILFVLCGFEHCIANAYLIIATGQLNLAIPFIINIFGNACGAKLVDYFMK